MLPTTRRFSKAKITERPSRKSGVGTKHTATGPIKEDIEVKETKSLTKHKENILSGLEVLWRRKQLCDVALKVGNKTVFAHKVVLCTSCDYFHDIFCGSDSPQEGVVELVLNGINEDATEAIIECIYTGKIKITDKTVRHILYAAHFLKSFSIEVSCTEFLSSRLNKSNCLRLLNLGFTYHLSDLVDAALHIAAQNFIEVSESFDYCNLDIGHLVSLLCRDDLEAPSELDVFHRALAWLEHDGGRRQYLLDVLQNIRLPLLTPSQIVDHVESVSYIMSHKECQELVTEALKYHCLPARQSIMQSPRTVPRSSVKFNCVVLIGGAPRLKSEPVNADIMYLDSKSDTWRLLTSMPGPRHHHAVAVLGGFVYVAGGEESNDQKSPLSSVYRYDPRTELWLRVADMKHQRESFQLGVLNGMLYAVGGRVDERRSLAAVERYNPAVDEWEEVAPLSGPRRSVSVAAQNGRLYAIGGSGDKRISSKVERYNPLSNHWEQRRSLGTPRFFALLACVGQKLYLIGGATLDRNGCVTCVSTVECYTPVSDSWVTVSSMLDPRAEAGCTVMDNSIYVVGGYSWNRNQRLRTVERYDVLLDKWSEVVPIKTPYTGVGCACLTLYRVPEKQQQQQQQQTKQQSITPITDSSDSCPSLPDEKYLNKAPSETHSDLEPPGEQLVNSEAMVENPSLVSMGDRDAPGATDAERTANTSLGNEGSNDALARNSGFKENLVLEGRGKNRSLSHLAASAQKKVLEASFSEKGLSL